jgi:hypothetical protein
VVGGNLPRSLIKLNLYGPKSKSMIYTLIKETIKRVNKLRIFKKPMEIDLQQTEFCNSENWEIRISSIEKLCKILIFNSGINI